MSNAVIPWHVFHDAIETSNPYSLNLWLERWRFMDGGVILFHGEMSTVDFVTTPLEPKPDS